MKSTISVVIPTYNRSKMLEEAILSVLNQSFSDFEVIILDNCSDDDTESIVTNLAFNDRRVRYVKNRENIGALGNFKKSLCVASGEFLLILGDDDVLVRDALLNLYGVMQRFPRASFAYGTRVGIDNKVNISRTKLSDGSESILDQKRMSRRLYFRGNVVGEPSAVLIKTNLAKDGFSYGFLQLLDVGMWLHLLKFGPCVRISEVVVRIRVHPQRLSNENQRNGTTILDFKELFKVYGATKEITGNIFERGLWDTRMLWRVAKYVCSSRSVEVKLFENISEVYHPVVFKHIVAIVVFYLGFWNVIRNDE